MRFQLKDIKNMGLLIAYKITLDIIYVFNIAPYYSYTGLTYQMNVMKYLITFILFIVLAQSVIKLIKRKNPSSNIVLLINLLYFIPGLTFITFSDQHFTYLIFYAVYLILFNFLNKVVPLIDFSFSNIKNRNKIFKIIVGITVLGSILIAGKYNNFKLSLNFIDVYSMRSAVSDMNLPRIVGYFKPFASSIIPIALMIYMINKKVIMILFLVLLQFFLFAFGGHKTTIFILFAVFAIFFLMRESFKTQMLKYLFLINVISTIHSSISRDLSLIVAYLHRRTMFTPNLISTWYYDFFTSHSPDYLHQSFLKYFGFSSQYQTKIPFMIALEYTGDISGANNGMIGDAISNFGFLGLLLYPFFLTIAFRFFDYCAKDLNEKVISVASLIFAINFINSSFFTVLLTHGFLIITISLYYFPRKLSEKNVIGNPRLFKERV